MSSSITLLRLPHELKLNIFSYLSKRDLFRLGLTCNILYDAALPDLYRSFHCSPLKLSDCATKLNTLDSKGAKAQRLFGAGNPGSSFIRELNFSGSLTQRRSSFRKLVAYVFIYLPQDVLIKLQLPRDEVVHYSLVEFILLRQRNVTSLELGSLSGGYSVRDSTGAECLPTMRRLAFHSIWVERETVPYMNSLIRRCPNLTELAIHRSMHTLDLRSDFPVLPVLFQHITPDGVHQAIRLRKLVLEGIDLASPAEYNALSHALDLCNLQSLHVRCKDCMPIVRLLHHLVVQGWTPPLSDIVLSDTARRRDIFDEKILESLLQACVGLRRLVLSLRGFPTLLSIESLIKSGRNLRELVLNVRTRHDTVVAYNDSWGEFIIPETYSRKDFTRLCAGCPNLELLAMPLHSNLNEVKDRWLIGEHDRTLPPAPTVTQTANTNYATAMDQIGSHDEAAEDQVDDVREWIDLRNTLSRVERVSLIDSHNSSERMVRDAPASNVVAENFDIFGRGINDTWPGEEWETPELAETHDIDSSGYNFNIPGPQTPFRCPGQEYAAYLDFQRAQAVRLNPGFGLESLQYGSHNVCDRFSEVCERSATAIYQMIDIAAQDQGRASSKLKVVGVLGVYADTSPLARNELFYLRRKSPDDVGPGTAFRVSLDDPRNPWGEPDGWEWAEWCS